MALLAAHSPDPELRDLYAALLASEARHFGLYWVLCERRWPRPVVTDRLTELAGSEAEILASLHPQPRMHS
jgi:tRNA-(ms[2]io[6]A)-hydroxylase